MRPRMTEGEADWQVVDEQVDERVEARSP